jgi:hypothetical protein
VHQQQQGTAGHTPQTLLKPLAQSRLQGPGTHRQQTGAASDNRSKLSAAAAAKPAGEAVLHVQGRTLRWRRRHPKATMGAPHFKRAGLLNLGLVSWIRQQDASRLLMSTPSFMLVMMSDLPGVG